MRARFLDIGGLGTRILEAGRGDKLLLLHPVGFSGDVWFRTLPVLAERHSVCAPDMLGHGFSALYDRTGRIGHGPVLDHVAELVDTLGWDRFAVAGSSFGGLIAGLLALRWPDRVSRLMIIGSGSAVQPPAETEKSLAATLANGGAALDDPSWTTCRRRLGNLCFDPAAAHDELLLAQLSSCAREGAAAAYRALLAAMIDPVRNAPYRLWGRFGEIAMPTLLLWGRQDPRAGLAWAEAAADQIPNARLVTMDHCGHLPFLEHPAAFNRVAAEFFAAS
jgi:pimeloyl-ACP methyl ester carboxylesterase